MEWLVLMVYMLDWNRHFTFIETLLGIREVSYAVEGYLLLATFAVKAAKTLYAAFRAKEKSSELKENK